MPGWRNVKHVWRATEGKGLGMDKREKPPQLTAWHSCGKGGILWPETISCFIMFGMLLFCPDYKACCRNFVKYIKASSINIIAPNIILVFWSIYVWLFLHIFMFFLFGNTVINQIIWHYTFYIFLCLPRVCPNILRTLSNAIEKPWREWNKEVLN